MSRSIGIRHRVKKTSRGEARPTQVAVVEGRKIRTYNLEDETAELDFIRGYFPTKHRKPEADEDVGKFPRHQLNLRALKKGEADGLPPNLLVMGEGKDKKKFFLVTGVPAEWDGIMAGDVVAMSLGGSGDYLAFAISRRGDAIGSEIWRIPPSQLKSERSESDDDSKDKDAELMARLVETKRELFRPVTPRDRDGLLLRINYRSFEESLKARIATEQRLYQRLIGEVFCSEDGLYPEGGVEAAYREAKANDKILLGQVAEEKAREAKMLAALGRLDAFRKVLEPVEGVGTRIAARILAGIGDVNRFVVKPYLEEIERLRQEATDWADIGKVTETAYVRRDREARREFYERIRKEKLEDGKTDDAEALTNALAALDLIRKLKRKADDRSVSRFKHYCGVHVRSGGKYGIVPANCQFPKNESGEVSDWCGTARQAFWLIASDQCNKRPDSEWGQYRRRMKEGFRERHPEPIAVQLLDKDGKPKLHKKGKRKGEPIVENWYTDGHIYRMAVWRTATRFAEWLFRELMKLERQGAEPTREVVKTLRSAA